MKKDSALKFHDIINRYGFLFWGFIAVIYLSFTSTFFWWLQDDIGNTLQEYGIVNYFCLVSILVLCVSIAKQWTWPIKVDELLLVVFLWILITNLLPRDCPCCSANTPPIEDFSATNNNQQQQKQKDTSTKQDVEKQDIDTTIKMLKEPDKVDTTAPGATKKKQFMTGPPTMLSLLQYTAQAVDECNWPAFTIIYSLLAVTPMLVSFFINSRNIIVSYLSTTISLILMIGVTLIPISCNQFTLVNVNINLVKFTLYCIIWIINKQMRLTETVLSNEYQNSINLIYFYMDKRKGKDQDDRLISNGTYEPEGDDATTHSQYQKVVDYGYQFYPSNSTTPYSYNNNSSQYKYQKDHLQRKSYVPSKPLVDEEPVKIFKTLERLDTNIRERNDKKYRELFESSNTTHHQQHHHTSTTTHSSNKKKRVPPAPRALTNDDMIFNAILAHLLLIYEVHQKSTDDRWLNSFFSWKNRFYNANLQNIYDLTRTIWILNVCPSFLAFIIIEYLIIIYNIRWNKNELATVMEIAKSMSFIYKKDRNRHQALTSVVI